MNTVLTSKFRIKEYKGKFDIQRKIIETRGFLWWKKTEEKWRSINDNGVPLYVSEFKGHLLSNWHEMNESYNSLEEATESLLKMIKQPVYHDVNIE